MSGKSIVSEICILYLSHDSLIFATLPLIIPYCEDRFIVQFLNAESNKYVTDFN